MSASSPDQVARALHFVGEGHRRVLDPIERFSEIMFGLIMVLAFTGASDVARGGREDVREMLIAALGCNLAWGLIDGVMYVLTSLSSRARRESVLLGIRAADSAQARAIVLHALPEAVASVTERADADQMVARIKALPEPHGATRVTLDDLKGAAASMLLVLAATLPPTLPYVFMHNVRRAQATSNVLAVGSLFLAGYFLGKAAGIRPWLLGLAMVLLGGGLVGLTLLLGG